MAYGWVNLSRWQANGYFKGEMKSCVWDWGFKKMDVKFYGSINWLQDFMFKNFFASLEN